MAETNQQIRILMGIEDVYNRAQNLRQRFRTKFRSSTRAFGIAGQSDLATRWVDR
jgi:hypothetical protein